jgi:hypothetical protein
MVLSNENPEDFDAFKVGLANELNPQGELEEALAEKIVADLWRLRRVPVLESALYKRGEMGAMEAGLGEADPSVSHSNMVARNVCGYLCKSLAT